MQSTRSKIVDYVSFGSFIALALLIAYLLKKHLHFCDPATVFIGVASFILMASGIPKLLGMHYYVKSQTGRIYEFALQCIVAIAMTGLISLVCSTGYTLLAWLLVIAMVLLYFLLFYMSSSIGMK